jgi:hypothetical protein
VSQAARHPDQFYRYQWVYHALQAAGVPIAVLKRDEKRITGYTAAAVARQKARMLAREAAYLLDFTIPSGRVLDKDLLKLFQEWNPEIEVTPNLFTRAVTAVLGHGKKPSGGKQYWMGFHIPTAEELKLLIAKAA